MNDLRQQLQLALRDDYELEHELGGGGMSRVFVAHERALGRRVVVKVLPPDLAVGLNSERFRREIQVVAQLQHPHIVPVLSAGDAGGVPFFTMPFVEGQSLRQMLEAGESIAIADVRRLLRDVAAALSYAHARGVVHRDIKPDNVLVSHGSAMVTDFGVAKALSTSRESAVATSGTLTALGTSLGSPSYIAPEQAAGDPDTDHRADLYSFGVMAYELLAGVPPFAGRPPHALIVAHLTETPRPVTEHRPDTPASLATLVECCLAKDPGERPQSAAELVEWLEGVTPAAQVGKARSARDGGRTTAPGAPPSGPSARGGRSARRVAGVAAAIAVVAAVAWGAWKVSTRAGGAGSAAPPAGAGVAAPPALAVLPLVNSGGDPRDEYFSDGMTDEITDALAAIPGLRVVSRTSAFAYKNKAVDAREIGRALNVGMLVEGRVRRERDQLRVTAQLTNADDGLTLWSETYARSTTDLFAIQDEIAGAVAKTLQLRLISDRGARPGSAVRDLEAHDLYLRGRFLLHKRGALDLEESVRYFERAVAREATFPEAWAAMAEALVLLPVYGGLSADSALPRARVAAERAITQDSTLAEGNTVLGLVLKSEGKWVASQRALERARALNPRLSATQQWLGELAIITGRPRDAVEAFEVAAQLDPSSPVVHAELAYALGLVGRAEEAYRAGERGIALGPQLWTTHAFLGYAYLFTGRPRDAIPLLERAVSLDSTVLPVVSTLAFVYGASGQTARARTLAMQLEARAATPSGSPVAVAIAYAGVGDRVRALDWLERAQQRRDPWLYAMSVTATFFDSLRQEPRFAEVVRAMGLDVARVTGKR